MSCVYGERGLVLLVLRERRRQTRGADVDERFGNESQCRRREH